MVLWGASANTRTFWRKDHRERIGWLPQDSADIYAGQMLGKTSGDPVIELYQGGAYTRIDYSRAGKPPGDLFAG
jgi:uronate dehydrogenase